MTIGFAAFLCAPLSADQSTHRPKPELKKKEAEIKQIDRHFRAPTLKLPAALKIATSHLKEEQIELSGHFLESIRLTEVEGKNGSYWRLKWVPNAHAIGGEIWVYVSMDRRLKPSIEFGR